MKKNRIYNAKEKVIIFLLVFPFSNPLKIMKKTAPTHPRNEKHKIKLPAVEGKLLCCNIFNCLLNSSVSTLSRPSFFNIATLILAIL